MKFDELDAKLRVFETAHDLCVLPGIFMVARVDGRSFTRLTKDHHQFETPYDERFRDYMVETAKALMNCGFRAVYAYTQSDEISILLHRDEETFGRKLRKLNSVLAGEASARFSMLLGDIGIFDSRISQLPNVELAIDYFRWRHEDAARNALNAHCYWMLRKEGQSAGEATQHIHKFSVAQKNELLFQRGINFNDIPNWQKRGVGLYWESYKREGIDLRSQELVTAQRRQIQVNLNLPMKDKYSSFIKNHILREHPDLNIN